MTDHQGSKTPKAVRDLYETPQDIYDYLDSKFDFQLDVCAQHETAKNLMYFTIQDDAFTKNWASYCSGDNPAVYCNPPYSNIRPWIDHAMTERERGLTTVFLVDGDYSVGWWPDDAEEVWLITGYPDPLTGRWHSGRISFIDPITRKPKPGKTKPSAVIIFRPNPKYEPQILKYVSKLTLMGG